MYILQSHNVSRTVMILMSKGTETLQSEKYNGWRAFCG
jgi:hypothetical protein